MTYKILSPDQCYDALLQQKNPFFDDYFAFYSSWYGGIVLEPRLMQLPLDDHMVHRGDGVFEAMKVVSNTVYLMDAHLERLLYSAGRIGLVSPWSVDEIKAIVLETLLVTQQEKASIRVFLSRGPGDFSANPYDAIAPQLYVVVMRLKELNAEKYTSGVAIGKSSIPPKPDWMSQIKSCNYLPNVLMKREAVDRGLDYVIGVDDHGFVTESATENVLIVDKAGVIIHPPFEHILKGTTMIRVCELAKDAGLKTKTQRITIDELQDAAEIMMVGTTINVLPVVTFEQVRIQDGRPARVAQLLHQKLLMDQFARSIDSDIIAI